MGMKSIWDGQDLPPEGCQVLAHLASQNAWVRHVVTGYKVSQGSRPYNHRVEIQLEESDDPRSGANARLLDDIRPLDDLEAVLSSQQEWVDELKAKADARADTLRKIEEALDGDPKALPDTLMEIMVND